MKTLTFGRRLNNALAALVLLFIAGLGVAVLIGDVEYKTAKANGELQAAQERIIRDLVEMSSATSDLLASTKPDLEGVRLTDAEKDLSAVVATLERDRSEQTLFGALEGAQRFAQQKVGPFQDDLADLLKTDRGTAVALYNRKAGALRDEQRSVIRDLEAEVTKVADAATLKSRTIALFGWVVLLILVTVGIVIVRSPVAAVTESLGRLQDAVEQMQNGDFTRHLDPAADGQLGGLGDGLNRVAEDVSALVKQVSRSGIQVNTTATEIAATAKEQQSTANEIAATTAEIGATSRQISATSRELETTMNEVGRVAQDTAQLANSGQTAIAGMEGTMRQIMDAAATISAKLAVLNDKTANVNTVVTTITKVADQTNLLSLNAAIEAEKAGEYGLGFAVVATEIRRLADQTAVATYDIEKMVKEMQSAVAAGVMGMDKFSEEVRRGVDEIRQVGAQLAQIIHQVQTLLPRFQVVNEGMHAQATGAQQISETLTQLSEAAHQTADSLLHSNIAIDQLNDAARGLQASVAKFKARN